MSWRRKTAIALMLGFAMVAGPQLAWTPASAKDTKPAAAAAALLDLNTATAAELEALPGIGPAKAKAIVEGRPYSSLKDFESRNIVAASVVEKFKDQVTVAQATTKAATTETAPAAPKPAAPAGKIDLNTASVDELETLPGIGPVKAKAIVDGRPYSSLKDFESRNILAASVLEKVKGGVTVSKAKAAATETAPETKAAQPAAPAGKIDLNTATTDELQTLTGIGPVKAKAIADGRPYSSLKDFESRNILAASVFDKIKGEVTVAKAPAKPKPAVADAPPEEANPPEPLGKINLNTATAEELEVLPGIGPVKAKAIIDGRPYGSIADFEAKGIVAKSTVEKFKDAIEVDAPAAKAAEATTGTPGQIAAQKRIRMCGAKWRAAKAENKLPAGLTWPQFWSQCNTALKKQGY